MYFIKFICIPQRYLAKKSRRWQILNFGYGLPAFYAWLSPHPEAKPRRSQINSQRIAPQGKIIRAAIMSLILTHLSFTNACAIVLR